jgi:hypothetical protein
MEPRGRTVTAPFHDLRIHRHGDLPESRADAGESSAEGACGITRLEICVPNRLLPLVSSTACEASSVRSQGSRRTMPHAPQDLASVQRPAHRTTTKPNGRSMGSIQRFTNVSRGRRPRLQAITAETSARHNCYRMCS